MRGPSFAGPRLLVKYHTRPGRAEWSGRVIEGAVDLRPRREHAHPAGGTDSQLAPWIPAQPHAIGVGAGPEPGLCQKVICSNYGHNLYAIAICSRPVGRANGHAGVRPTVNRQGWRAPKSPNWMHLVPQMAQFGGNGLGSAWLGWPDRGPVVADLNTPSRALQ